MKVSQLLAWLLGSYFRFGVVDGQGGGGAGDSDDERDDDDTPEGADVDGDQADDGDDGDHDADEGDEPGEGDDGGDGEDAGTVISLGEQPEEGEQDENRAPNWVRELRKSNREKDRRIRELESQVAAAKPVAVIEVGKEPDPDDYDMFEPEGKAKFKADWAAWNTRKSEAEAAQRNQQAAQEAQEREWKDRLKAVDTAGAALKVADHDDAVEALADVFSVAQMGMLIDAASDATKAAQLRYALGKNHTEAARLAAIKHPVKFIAEIARLEQKLKVTPRKSAPPPDTPVRSAGGGSKASAVDNQLERAREAARKTGDYSKVMELKRAQAARAKKRA